MCCHQDITGPISQRHLSWNANFWKAGLLELFFHYTPKNPIVLQSYFFMASHFTVEYSQPGFILKSSPTHVLLIIVHPESNTLFVLFCVTTVRPSIFNKLHNSVMENSWPWISHMVFLNWIIEFVKYHIQRVKLDQDHC